MKQRALVLLQDSEPAGQILRVIGARGVADGEIGAQEGAAELGHQFLEGVRRIAKALAELAVETAFSAGPMDVMPISA